jgi:zinc protease
MMRKFIPVCLAVFLWASSPAQASILDIQEVTSPKGVKAWLVEDHTAPVIALKFTFTGSGAICDPAEKQGLSQLLSNTLDEGAGKLDSRGFQKELNNSSIQLSFFSSRDDFGGNLKTLSRNREKAFDLLRLALTEPRFDTEPTQRMIDANLSRIRSQMTEPDWIAARLTNDILFGAHPYALNSGGTLTSLAKLTPDDLRAKVKQAMARDRLQVSVAGDISKTELTAALDHIFGALPDHAALPEFSRAELPQKAETILYKKDIPQTVIQMVLPGLRMDDPDYFAAEVTDFIFGSSGFGSRLTDLIREEKGLTYGIYSDLSQMDKTETLNIGSSTKNATAQELIDLTKSVMEDMRENPVLQKEIHAAVTYLTGSVPLSLTSTDKIAGVMQGFQRYGLPRDYLDRREKALKALTAADIQRVSKRLLTPEKLSIILVGGPENTPVSRTVTTLPNTE